MSIEHKIELIDIIAILVQKAKITRGFKFFSTLLGLRVKLAA